MKDVKKLILVLSIICIIIIIILLLVLNKLKNNTIDSNDEIEIVEEETSSKNILQEVKYKSDYYAVKDCIQKFYAYYQDIFQTEESSLDNVNAVYDMLDQEYKDYVGITKENLKEKFQKMNSSHVNINEMYVDQKTENIYVYIVKGRLREIGASNVSSFEIMLIQDISNKTFTVFLEDYINKYYNNIELGEELKIQYPESIKINDYNTYDYEIIDEETYVTDLIEKYKEEVLFDIESAYKHLDEEYRQKRFESLKDFETYAKENIIRNVSLKIDSYKKTVYDEYTEYVCTDKKGNYYIFKEKTVMNYGVILDNYTVNLPDFIEKYDNQKDEQKVALNINKIKEAINEKDYKYVYNKLNNTYKNTYFSDFNTFTNYLKNRFYSSNNISIEKCESTGQNTYISTIKISDSNNLENTKNIIMIIRLLEDRDFEMSFAIE